MVGPLDSLDECGTEATFPTTHPEGFSSARGRIKVAEILAAQAVSAEVMGDHKSAAGLYRKALDVLLQVAEVVVSNDAVAPDEDRCP